MTWEYKQSAPKPERHHGIKCLDCNKILLRKTECTRHKGHEVVYLDAKGEPVR